MSIIRRIGLVLKFENVAVLYVAVIQLIVILEFFLGGLRYNKLLLQSKIHPARLFVLSFVFTIIIGALFLLLPKATTAPHQLSMINALFTSTSAVCVTGLITVDTAVYFSRFGQTIILILIQIGGLGLMTFTTFFALFLASGLGLRERFLLQDMLGEQNINKIGKVIAIIIFVTIGIEFVGAIALFQSIRPHTASFEEAAFNAIFHSVSAFCNAGFSIFTLNLMDPSIRYDYIYTTTISFLIIIGGIWLSYNNKYLQ